MADDMVIPDLKDHSPNAESKLHYQRDAAAYIAALVAELRNLSGMAELAGLTRALDAAFYEAYAVNERKRVPKGATPNTDNA